MSNKFILSCCSTADLSAKHFEDRDIKYICFHYTLDGKQYYDDLGKTMPIDQFYQAMVDGAETKTSQVNVDEYEKYFEPFLEAGLDVLDLLGNVHKVNGKALPFIALDQVDILLPDARVEDEDTVAVVLRGVADEGGDGHVQKGNVIVVGGEKDRDLPVGDTVKINHAVVPRVLIIQGWWEFPAVSAGREEGIYRGILYHKIVALSTTWSKIRHRPIRERG